jgi:hypothetical protein
MKTAQIKPTKSKTAVFEYWVIIQDRYGDHYLCPLEFPKGSRLQGKGA